MCTHQGPPSCLKGWGWWRAKQPTWSPLSPWDPSGEWDSERKGREASKTLDPPVATEGKNLCFCPGSRQLRGCCLDWAAGRSILARGDPVRLNPPLSASASLCAQPARLPALPGLAYSAPLWRPQWPRAAQQGRAGPSAPRLPPPPPPSSPSQNTQCRNVPKMTSERSRIPCLSAAAAEGTGKKQQEGTAMATLHRKVPSPEAFLGKPWSSWIDAAKLHCSDSKNPTACSSFYYPVTFPFT